MVKVDLQSFEISSRLENNDQVHHRAGQLDCVPQRVLLCVVFIKLCAIVILKEWDQDRDCVQSSQLCHCVHSASEWSVRVRFSWSTPPSSPCLYCPVFLPHQPPRLPNHLQTPLKLPFPDKSHGLPRDQILIAFISLNFQFPTILFNNGITPLAPFHTFLISFNRFSFSYFSLSSAPSFHICFSPLKHICLIFCQELFLVLCC